MEGLKCSAAVFKDDKLSVGGHVKSKGEVLKEYFNARSKPPNLNFRVESFGRICQTFDSRRRRWVNEIGFGGLLYLSGDMHIPRQLGYWLMTRIDPYNKMVISPDGRCLRLSRNQVHWILGIPNGSKVVPSYKTLNKAQREKGKHIISKYGQTRKTLSSNGDSRVGSLVGIPVYPELMDKLECHWEEHEEDEFKTLFLLLALQMFLCPTLSPRLASDLVPALTCAMDAVDYDWCTLVLTKLLASVRSFGQRFYSKGHAGGCGGCTLFALIFYLDRLDREAVDWGVFPRLKVWNIKQIVLASKEDRSSMGGDYGKIGTLDVAYGEIHPRQARDTDRPTKVEVHDTVDCFPPRPRRGASSSKSTHKKEANTSGGKTGIGTNNGELGPTLQTLNQTHTNGYIASSVHLFIEALHRSISTDALFLFRSMTSFAMTICSRLGGSPLLGEVVSFGGGSCDWRSLLLPSLGNFVLNRYCRLLVVVSEVYASESCTAVTSTPVLFRICIALKANSPSEMILIQGDSVTPTISAEKRRLTTSEQVQDDIFQYCLKGLCDCKLSRNMVLVDTKCH